MKKISPILLGLSIVITGTSFVAAQDAATLPKVLQITREYLKPYKSGAAHDKTESAFIAALSKAKFPAYYIGLNSLSGKSRALYLTSYASFAEWEKDNKIVDKSPTLNAELDRASVADGENLDEVDSVVYVRDDELSYHPHADISHARYMEVEVFQVRPGHEAEFREAAKMVKAAHDKAGDGAHWAMFEIAFGGESGTFVALSGDNSMADIDNNFASGKKFADTMGEDGMKKLDHLTAEAIETWHNELFSVNPKQSYVNPDWIKADSFWNPKPAAAPKPAAPAEKKATP